MFEPSYPSTEDDGEPIYFTLSGPAVIDIGFLLSSCDTELSWTPPLPRNPQRVQAIIDGYCRYHSLVEVELDRLEDAIRFRSLVYGACGFADAIRAQQPEDPDDWWWRRYSAAGEIADQTRQCFADHRSTQYRTG